jgi:hypothetical protein
MTTPPQAQIVIDAFATFDRLLPDPFFEFFSDDVIIVDEIGKKWLRGKDAAIATWTPLIGIFQSSKSVISDIHVDNAGDISIVTCMLDQTYVLDGQTATITAPT